MKITAKLTGLVTAFLSSATMAITLVVNTNDDLNDGACDIEHCSLREAIVAANSLPGQDTIDFGGIVLRSDTQPVSISLLTALPVISDSVILNGAIRETRSLPGNPKWRPGVELDLSLATPAMSPFGFPLPPNGLSIFGPSASGTVIRGLVINGINRQPPLGFEIEFCFFASFNPNPADPSTPALQFCSHTISIFGADNVQVSGNYLNMDIAGEQFSGDGVTAVALLDASNALIGGDSADDRNVMSSSDHAAGYANLSYNMIIAWAQGWAAPAFGGPRQFNSNRIVGNYMAVTASGVAMNTVARGIWLKNRNTPDVDSPVGMLTEGWGPQCGAGTGDACEMRDNVIRGNTLTSIGFRSTFALFGGQHVTKVSDNVTYNTDGGAFGYQGKVEFFANETGAPSNALVKGNRFGLDAEGQRAAAPAELGLTVGVGTNIRIENNIIAGALLPGVVIFENSIAGLDTSQNVTLSRNAIVDTCLSGLPDCPAIDLLAFGNLSGRTPNDELDPDSGANHLQNYPVLLEISPSRGRGSDKIVARLDSASNEVYLVEFFSSEALNASNESEGERFIGQTTVSTDSKGHAEFSFNYNGRHAGGLVTAQGKTFITATATRKHCEPQTPGCLYGSTSEFSPACAWNLTAREAIDCRD